MSLAGGMDLSKLKNDAPQIASALKVASLVAGVTEKTLPTLVTISKTAPVILEFHEESADADLESAVRARNGSVMLARVAMATEGRVAEAFGVRGAPSLFALIQGKPMPIYEGKLSPEQIEAVLDQLIQGAKAQGVTGKLVEGEVGDPSPTLPAPLQEALALVDSGAVDEAFELLTKLKAESPKDVATSALLAQVTLMQRTMNLDHEKLLESQPTNFDEAIQLADVLVAIGDFQNSFDLLLALYSQVSSHEQELVKTRMLEYFEIAGANNDAVKTARAKLATLLY